MRRMDELGGPTTFNHYPIGWAHAMDTPFQWTKQIASHFGGTRNGMVMSWPARIKDKGGIRTQFHHVIDIAPTILEAAGLQMPAVLNGVPQKPIEGVSMVYSFDDAKAPSTHRTQYFEMFANRAIYNDGWVAATTPPLAPWAVGKTIDVDDYKWELYDVSKDFSEANDLAAQEPKKLHELQELFWIEAAKNEVLPLDNSKIERMNVDNRPSLTRGRAVFTYYPGMTRIPEGSAPSILNKSFKIGAEVEIPEGGAERILVTQGGRFNGWGFYLLAGKPVFAQADEFANQIANQMCVTSQYRPIPWVRIPPSPPIFRALKCAGRRRLQTCCKPPPLCCCVDGALEAAPANQLLGPFLLSSAQ
jgi:hypothetical protein